MKRRSCLAAVLLLVLVLAAGVLGIRWGGEALGRALHPKEYSEYVEYYADKYRIDPLLLYSFICTESGFDPEAQSSVDARGLMQITDETFQWIKSKIAPTEALTFEDLYDPEVNVRFGSYYLAVILERYDQDIATAAAAYHSGWGTVDQLLAAMLTLCQTPAEKASDQRLVSAPLQHLSGKEIYDRHRNHVCNDTYNKAGDHRQSQSQ